jgi:hydroxymethylglutaryl-CoA synthase
VGNDFPLVDGPLSLDCYKRAAERCFRALVGDGDAEAVLSRFAALCFHVPFPKMVQKAVFRIGDFFGWDEERIKEFIQDKVNPTMLWNRLCGNAYTASLWISVANALKGLARGERIAAFSYGSGFGAELLVLEAGPKAEEGAWAADVEEDLRQRNRVDAEGYKRLRGWA